MTHALRNLLLAALLLAACDGLGRPLVDSTRGGGSRSTTSCETLLTCPRAVPSITVADFSFELPARCTEQPVLTLDTRQLLARGHCQCERLQLSIGSGDVLDELLSDLTFEDCTLELLAAQPAALRLERLSARRSRLELTGSVTLIITDAALLDEVAVGNRSPSPGAVPRLVVEQSRAHALLVEDVMEVELVRSELSLSRLITSKLSAESSLLSECIVTADWFGGVDLTLDGVLLAASGGSLSASRAARLSLSGCQSFLLAGTTAVQSQLLGCSELLRLYGSSLKSSLVNGPIESDGTSFFESKFGVGATTQLTAWETQIDVSAFCDGVDLLWLGSGTVRCSTCTGPLERPDAEVCQAEEEGFRSAQNMCRSLSEIAVCNQPFPGRQRP